MTNNPPVPPMQNQNQTQNQYVESGDVQSFSSWESMADVQLRYIEKLGQYKLNVAKAAVEEAKAANLNELAKLKARTVKEMDLSLKKMRSKQHDMQRRADRYAEHAKRADYIYRGDALDADLVPQIWIGFNVFMKEAPPSALSSMMTTVVDPAARLGTAFCYNRDRKVACENAPDTIVNVLELIAWMRDHKYTARLGGKSYQQIAGAFGELAKVANNAIAELNIAMAELEENVIKQWTPIMLAGINNPEAMRIAGSSV